jgi:hypothetical protein
MVLCWSTTWGAAKRSFRFQVKVPGRSARGVHGHRCEEGRAEAKLRRKGGQALGMGRGDEGPGRDSGLDGYQLAEPAGRFNGYPKEMGQPSPRGMGDIGPTTIVGTDGGYPSDLKLLSIRRDSSSTS